MDTAALTGAPQWQNCTKNGHTGCSSKYLHSW